MSTYVLVHGLWHDGSAWNEVIKHLERHGHTAFGPTLPGRGRAMCRNVTCTQCVQEVLNTIAEKRLTDIVLVGHSFGGTIISKVVELIPDRVRRLVFVSGVVLADGESVMDVGPPQNRPIFDELALASPDNTVSLSFELWCETYMNDAHPDLAEKAYASLFPEGYSLMVEPVDMKRFHAMELQMSYIHPTDDIVFPPGEWGWTRMTRRLRPHRYLEMPGSHEVLFSNPGVLASKIIEAGRD